MSIIPERFYQVIPPMEKSMEFELMNIISKENNGETIYHEIVNLMINPSRRIHEKYIFNKLTMDEAIEFLDMYNISWNSYMSKMDLCDLAERTYINLCENFGEIAKVPWAIYDLIHFSTLNINITQQYELTDLENMLNTFATVLEIPINEENTRERVIRILRMDYLIKI